MTYHCMLRTPYIREKNRKLDLYAMQSEQWIRNDTTTARGFEGGVMTFFFFAPLCNRM